MTLVLSPKLGSRKYQYGRDNTVINVDLAAFARQITANPFFDHRDRER